MGSVKVNDIAKVTQGGKLKLSGKHFVKDGYPAYGAGGLNGYLPDYEFDCPAVILSANGARCGKCFYVDGKWSSLANTQVIIPDTEKIIPKFLWYQLNDENKWHKAGTAQPFIKPSDVKNRIVKKPNFEEQKEIVRILENSEDLRQKRKEQLALLDDYLKSVFLDMFGDPIINEKGLPQMSLGEVSSDIKYGTNMKCFERNEKNSTPVLRIPNIYKGNIDLADLKYAELDEKEFNKLLLRKGDLLFVRTNGNPDYIGRCAVFNLDKDYVNASYLIRVRLRENAKLLSSFICYIVSLPSYRSKIAKESRTTAGNYNINTQGLKNLKILQPSVESQKKFLSVAYRVEQAKQKMRASLNEMDNHFNALMQRYFG
ncbi:MAG: restriction endonuclease subunit S [Candidatus Cloacimonetes bacterium]|nr:restriction endonuclease subunit S [Candidatus Cloacimonadota bacterium]